MRTNIKFLLASLNTVSSLQYMIRVYIKGPVPPRIDLSSGVISVIINTSDHV